MQLASFHPDDFLANSWQKRPQLIRNPWAHWRNPLEPEELAGLACEEGIESRLILRGAAGLTMESGPLPESRFAALGAHPWTLLVQAVDHHVPEVAALIAPFRFVPDWRIDDVMVSFATTGGGVGPHYDQYDVFLIQGLGQRLWRVGPLCNADTPLLPHADLRLLADFTASEEWLLGPGDILYIPPGYAHDGIAQSDDCMTYSIGFRAPSRAELVEGWCSHLLDSLGEEAGQDDDRYADPDLARQPHPAEITPAAIDRLHAMVMARLADREGFARWFGQHSSLPKYAETDWRPEAPTPEREVAALLAAGTALLRNPAHRLAFIRQSEAGLVLFADGHSFDCAGASAAAAEQLCAAAEVTLDGVLATAAPVVALVTALIAQGSLAFAEPD